MFIHFQPIVSNSSEYLQLSEGDDVVRGQSVSQPISHLRLTHMNAFNELRRNMKLMETFCNQVQIFKFVLESGVLFITKSKQADLAPRAVAKFCVDSVSGHNMTLKEAVRIFPLNLMSIPSNLDSSYEIVLPCEIGRGLSTSRGKLNIMAPC